MLKKEEAIPWPGTLAIVHSYIAYKAGKELFTPFCVIFPCLGKRILEGSIWFVFKKKFKVTQEKLATE